MIRSGKVAALLEFYTDTPSMITVFGSINMDLVATAKRLPKPGETVTGETFSTAAGGKGANQALAARRAGATVKMAGAAGDDTFAAPALTLLRDAGTDLSLVKTTPGPTGTAVILIGEGGDQADGQLHCPDRFLAQRPPAGPLARTPEAIAQEQAGGSGDHDRAELQGPVRQDDHPKLPLNPALG